MLLRGLRLPLPSPPIDGGDSDREAALANPLKPLVGGASSSELMSASATLRFWPAYEGDSMFSGGHWQIWDKMTVPSVSNNRVGLSK
jgi:hypothetical protein